MPVDVKIFGWNAKDRVLSAELSDLPPGSFDDRRYLLVVGAAGTVRFEAAAQKRDADGDLMYLILRPTAGSVAATPACRGIDLVLFND